MELVIALQKQFVLKVKCCSKLPLYNKAVRQLFELALQKTIDNSTLGEIVL